VRHLALVLVLLASSACGAPSKERISDDFRQIFAKEVGAGALPVVLSVHPGEGDADNVYEHVTFDVFAEEDVGFKDGWLAGTVLRKGERLHDGEVVVLYQKGKRSQWAIARHELTRKPSERR